MSMPIIKPSCVKRNEAITDIIESIALEQTALSHILNAEGEKIQEILKCGRKEDILEVNESVKETINAITGLELILKNKLELFKECLCKEERHEC